jgi:hypothetical protein
VDRDGGGGGGADAELFDAKLIAHQVTRMTLAAGALAATGGDSDGQTSAGQYRLESSRPPEAPPSQLAARRGC